MTNTIPPLTYITSPTYRTSKLQPLTFKNSEEAGKYAERARKSWPDHSFFVGCFPGTDKFFVAVDMKPERKEEKSQPEMFYLTKMIGAFPGEEHYYKQSFEQYSLKFAYSTGTKLTMDWNFHTSQWLIPNMMEQSDILALAKKELGIERMPGLVRYSSQNNIEFRARDKWATLTLNLIGMVERNSEPKCVRLHVQETKQSWKPVEVFSCNSITAQDYFAEQIKEIHQNLGLIPKSRATKNSLGIEKAAT